MSLADRTGAWEIIDTLIHCGVEFLFCNLGTDHAPLIEELARREAMEEPIPKLILCPHENTAVHMAGGYAYVTGRCQAVLVHVDVGTANAAMGLHNLARMHLPVLLIAGRSPFSSTANLLGQRNSYINFVQDPFDQSALVRPYVKWENIIASADVAAEAIARAVERASAPPKGPVYLTAAREALAQSSSGIRPAARIRGPVVEGIAPHNKIEELAMRLLEAESPLLITAYAGRNGDTVELIDALAHFAGIRVIEFTPHTVNLAHDSSCHGGFVPHPYIPACDVGLLVDIDVPWVPALTRVRPDSFWAHIDTDVSKADFPSWPFPGDLLLNGHSGGTIKQLFDALRRMADPPFLMRAEKRLMAFEKERNARRDASRMEASYAGTSGALNAAAVCASLARYLLPEDIVLNEAVRNAAVVFEQIPRSLPGTRIGPAGGGLGYSAGMALGIKLARPDAMVVSVCGDGVAYFGNPQSALAVSVRYALPTLTVILDNGGWAAVKEATRKVYPGGTAGKAAAWRAELGRQTEFALVAKAAGALGITLAEPDEMDSKIETAVKAVRAGTAVMVHVHIAPL